MEVEIDRPTMALANEMEVEIDRPTMALEHTAQLFDERVRRGALIG